MSALHWLSYFYLKKKVLRGKKWDLNICCGKTDGGGVNADIVKHANVPNFVLVKDVHHLPFRDKQFHIVLCSHTIEHVDNPRAFYEELKRVGEEVIVITPPLWDILAVCNFWAHKWIIISFRKVHKKFPTMIPYPLGFLYAKLFGQLIKA